jgi:hypothetical protein
MKNLTILFLFACLASCASHERRIIVYASSDIQVDNSQKNITVSDGTTATEKILDFAGTDPVVLSVQSPKGKFSLEAKEEGLFVANLKPDTLVGSLQHIGADSGNGRITQEALRQKIDSLQNLMAGKNVSASNRNYFILPGAIQKITDQSQAKVFGPYTKIPANFDAGSAPEIYKFYSLGEMREMVDKLPAMTQFKF